MEEKLVIFISSRINDEMKQARQAVREAIEELPLTRPWLFEEAPAAADPLDESYLRWVSKCDLFILLLGEDITDPVKVEWETATQARKPRLVFLKEGARNDTAWEFAKELGVKWKEYRTLAELKREVQAAVGDEMIKGYRAYGVSEGERASLRAHVRELRAGDITIGGDVICGDKVGGDKVAGDKVAGDKVGRDKIVIVQKQPEGPPNLDALRKTYLAHLCRIYRYLDFKGIPQVQQVVELLPLERVYVGLHARPELPSGETWARVAGQSLDEASRIEIDTDGFERRMGLAEPVSVERLLKECPGLVVLGDPGAGKSTLLKVLALACAEGRARERLGLEGEWLPILLPLAAYAAALRKSEECSLLAFLPDYFRMRGLDCDLGPLLADALLQGRALVFLDGLDEVLEGRTFVAARVEDFFRQYAPAGNRLVITSRFVGYRDAPLRAEGLTAVTLVDFRREQIEQFAHNWCHAFEVTTHGDTPEAHRAAEAEKDELLQAIFSSPGVERLASNPLLLTILALFKRQGVTLPHRRVELYELYLRTLITAWSQARALDRRPVGPEMDYLETAQVLAPLALWLRETHPGAGMAPQVEVENWLAQYYQNEWGMVRGEARQKARGFLEAVHHYSNLLVERGEGTYGFIHLTLEEYLAAQGIAQRGQLDVGNTVKALHEHLTDPAWHETTLLTVGYLGIVQRNHRTAGAVVEGLLEADVPPAERGWNVVVAGEALHDVGPAGVTENCRQRVLERLVSVMQDADIAPDYRRQAGMLLGWLGWRPTDLDEWVEIPAGPFLYGDRRQERLIERPYRIGKYPVTNAQFACFIEAGGYDDERWWSEEGLAWRRGESDGQVLAGWRGWVRKRTPEQRNRPLWWDDPERANPLVPVVGVSWYEAEAYCRWLTEELQKADGPGEDEVARLPTEEEWERAARGTDGREYPWGEGFDAARANLKIGQRPADGSTAVMTYPEGVSPDGVWDCSGNVWEWTDSWWSQEKTYRVLRGGSWADVNEGYAHCPYRSFDPPAGFLVYYGFRVCVMSRQEGNQLEKGRICNER